MLTEVLNRLIRRWRIADGIRRLKRLDDRLLEDMGIARTDIPRFVRGELPTGKQGAVRKAATPVRNAYLRPAAESGEGDDFRVAV